MSVLASLSQSRRLGFSKTGVSLLAAFAVGIVALTAPPAAILILGAMGAVALMRTQTRLDIAALVGPAFAALIVGAFMGLSGAIGMLFVWRLFADVRWSVGEAARLAEASGRPSEARTGALLHAWTTPIYALMAVAYTAPHMVAGLPLDLPHVPLAALLISGGLAAAAVFDWAVRRAADWRLGELAQAPALHLLAHHVIFLAAFGLMLDVSAGMAALIAWRLAHAIPMAQKSGASA